MANLLLIDDDPDLLPDQMRQVFPAPAHRVEIAPTGSEGLERARDGRPDVILLDLRLPDQSGLDVLKQLRQIDARIPVVLVTVVRSADSAIEANPLNHVTNCRSMASVGLDCDARSRSPATTAPKRPLGSVTCRAAS